MLVVGEQVVVHVVVEVVSHCRVKCSREVKVEKGEVEVVVEVWWRWCVAQVQVEWDHQLEVHLHEKVKLEVG